MEGKGWGCSSNEDSDDEVYLQNASDEEELHFASDSLPKLQFRNVKSKGRWNEEMGMTEVIEKNGKMWVTTGIVRGGKIYTSIEETLYLMELGALHLVDDGNRSISLIEIYEKIVGRKSGCCWELFEAYRHLKSLGYIIGRHDVAWSLKSIKSSQKPVALEGKEESKQLVDTGSKVELSISKLFGKLKINDLKPDFDIYLPNSKFRKSSPGDSNFLLYLSRGHPPSRAEIEALERECGGILLKICLVTEGRGWGCSSNEDSDDEVCLQNASDEEELHFASDSLPKLQFRNVKSKGRWNKEMGMTEVIEKNGKMWVTTGIVRGGKIYTSIEETLYLMELGALHLVDDGNRSISLIELYEKIAGRKSGCCWELFEAYRHLKSLGYIIGRHDVAWSLKSIKSSQKPVALEGKEESKQLVDTGSKVELSISKLFGELKINDLKPDFDIYLPNSKFRKSSPGDSNFLLYLSRCHPPSKAEIEALERQCGGIPLKICLVTEGRDPIMCKKAAEAVVET